MDEELYNKYLRLNDSYKHTLTYTFVRTGFFSAINNMLLTMALCLKYKVRFRLYADDFRFFQGEGWNKVFASKLPMTHSSFFKNYNLRSILITNNSLGNRFVIFLHHFYQLITGNNLASAAFYESRTVWFSKEHFSFPELGIDGDLRDVCKELASFVYVFNDDYRNKIDEMRGSVYLPEKYIGIHIRRGDKLQEREYETTDKYIKLAEGFSDIRDAFILTDDFSIIEELENKYPHWHFYSLTFPYEKGFVLGPSTDDAERMDRELVKVLASLEIMSKGNLFIGTVSTNPGMFLGMVMDRSKVKYVDAPDWEVL